MAAVHKEAVVTENVVKDVLHRNQLVEKELCEKTVTGVLEDASVSAFLDLKPAQTLEDFIHARRFKLIQWKNIPQIKACWNRW